MFEDIFNQYRKAVDSSFNLQQELYRQWMNGLPGKPSERVSGLTPSRGAETMEDYQKRWSQVVADTLEQHRKLLNDQYQQGIDAISAAFQTTEAKTPVEFWRLTQEFWRKAIDSYKWTFQSQTKYLQNLACMWQELLTRGRV